jgi:hypothetical protein
MYRHPKLRLGRRLTRIYWTQVNSSFASKKQHINFFVIKDEEGDHRTELKPFSFIGQSVTPRLARLSVRHLSVGRVHEAVKSTAND